MVEDFEAWYEETYGKKVRVEYSTFGTNEDLYNMLTLGDVYDLVCPSEYMIMKLMAEDRVQPLSEEFFDEDNELNYYINGVSPYIRNIFETHDINGTSWDQCAAGYMWGVTGFVYNPEVVSEEEASTWKLMENTDYRRQITVKDNVRDTYFAAVGALKSDLLTSDAFRSDPDYAMKLQDEMNDTSQEMIDAAQEYLQGIKDNLYSFEKYNCYLEITKEYYRSELSEKAGVFDIGYSAKPELLFSYLLGRNIVTYFIHANSSEAYERNRCSGNELELFYDFKPTVTGVLRELLYSSTGASCKGYVKDGDTIRPVFSEKGYIDSYSLDVITSMHTGAKRFVKQYTKLFSKYFDTFDYNKYYMSIPLEYYLQYSLDNDRLMFKNLQFDDNEDKVFNILDFLKETERRYNRFYNLRRNDRKESVGIVDLPIERRKRLLYYLIFDRKTMHEKFIDKFNDMSESPSSFRRFCYCIAKDRKRLFRALKNSL